MIPPLLVQALIELGVEGIREIGPVVVAMVRGWFVSLDKSLRLHQQPESARDELYGKALRIVRNLETIAVPGDQKEQAARRVLLAWNTETGARFRKRHCYHALSTAVLALELPDEELPA